jgi:hypothetical protein
LITASGIKSWSGPLNLSRPEVTCELYFTFARLEPKWGDRTVPDWRKELEVVSATLRRLLRKLLGRGRCFGFMLGALVVSHAFSGKEAAPERDSVTTH